MDDPDRAAFASEQPDVTIDSPMLEVPESFRRRVALVEGSGPEITREIQHQLQCRLRQAALVMFFGFGIFLIRNLFWPGSQNSSLAFGTFHALVTVALGASGLSLCRSCPVSMWRLRVKEILIFGLPAIFLICLQYADMTESARQGFLPSVVSSWLLLMFTYAFLVPNRWKVASCVLGAMVVAPSGLILWLLATDPLCQQAQNADSTYVTNQLLALVLGAVIAVVGVRTLRLLRYEAFEARQLGQYHLRKLIGRGGMGDVYLAEHRLMRRPCAVKVIQPDRAGDPRSMARFEREVQAISKLSHWNSVDIYDYGRTKDGTFYYVMEFLPGMSLQQLVDKFGPLPASRAIHLLIQTCDALAEAHGQGLIHRDLKPANIFAAERGGVYDVAKLLDFGLAKPLVSDSSAELSVDGLITGSPKFMAPEQGLGADEVDARSDIYSLGAVGYCLLTGRPPFEGDKPLKLIFAHVNQPVVPPSMLQDGIPEDLESVLLRCLAKDPADRFQSVEDLARALGFCQDAGQWTGKDANAWWLECDLAVQGRSMALAT
ncbi:MAG: serine/threonine protein kinase [Planctomycetaceae bacterium]|nr:serine/threonine protein kinase [Planctomycetaceae bacterium]